jgi:hypothetical protein
MTETQLDVVYCEGWEPETRTLVGRFGAAAARERHERGEQYAVALTDEAGRPRVLLEIAMAQRFARAWHIDEHGHRPKCFVYCVLTDGRLFLRGTDEWPNLDEQEPVHVKLRYELDGSWVQDTEASYGSKRLYALESDEELTQPVPAFGDWLPLARLAEPVALRDIADPEPAGSVPPPWHPPAPMPPIALAETFTPGTRFALPGDIGTVVVETRVVGVLRLTSGRVIARDPGWLPTDAQPFTVTVPPGEYPVELAEVRFTENPEHVRVAAAKAVITPGQVESWELALLPGQDTAMLNDGEFYGIGVDAGLACLFDADALPALAADDNYLEDHWDALAEDPLEVTVPGSAANMIAFHSGWGDGLYPTWVGRTGDGTVAAFVVDLLVVHGAELVS